MQAEATLMLFARREKGYMERSERRQSYNRAPRGRRPRRRGRGYVYGVFALIVSIVIWPLGMLLLWARKLRWGAGVKVLSSLLTLILCLCWIGWALTVQTDDYRITRVQDQINTFLSDAAEAVSTRADAAAKDIAAFSSDLYRYAGGKISEGVVVGVSLAGDAKDWARDVFAGAPDSPAPSLSPDESADASAAPEESASPTPKTAPTDFLPSGPVASTGTPAVTQAPTGTSGAGTPAPSPTQTPTTAPTQAPTPTPLGQEDVERILGDAARAGRAFNRVVTVLQSAAPTTEPTAAPTAEPTAAPTAEPTAAPTAEPTAAPTAEPTAAPTAEPTVVPTAEPTVVPTAEPTAEPTAAPTAEPTAEPTAAPTLQYTPAPAQVTAEPTALDIEAEPTPAPTLKPAGEAIVYHSSNGVGYHVRSSCVGMSGAKPYTLAQSVRDGFRSCGNCKPADESLLTTDEPVVWVDKNDLYHTSDECADFEGQYVLMTLKDAYEKGKTACAACGATSYVYTPAETLAPTAEPTPEPTPAPTAAPPEVTATPAAEAGGEASAQASVTRKPAGEAIVYRTSNGRAYHVAETCVGMSGAKPYTLAEVVADGYKPCGHCNPPAAELVSADSAWVDEGKICHVSDECAYFEGKYALVKMDKAVSDGLEGCPFCGMGDMLREYGEERAAEQARLTELSKGVTVYYNDNSRYYHAADTCVNMPSADAHTLYDALEKGLKRCSRCEPPTLDDLRDGLDAGAQN